MLLSVCRRTVGSLAFGLVLLQPTIAPAQNSASSLLLLIDTSGSMGDPVGNGNSQIKIDAAKQAAMAAVDRAARNGTVEIAVLAFEGECSDPVPRRTGFTSDFEALQRFIAGLQPGGGTPMAQAMLLANRFMQSEASANARDRMIVLLADGENDCGSINDALAEMQAAGVIFRHETVGFGIAPNSRAESDLQEIATATSGIYHRAADAAELGDLLVQFIDTFSLIDRYPIHSPFLRNAEINRNCLPKRSGRFKTPTLSLLRYMPEPKSPWQDIFKKVLWRPGKN